ncbi:hypothetical protein AVEN_186005-1 [Araneus ventricosus]|uniref:Uncharacterized protein n=1 Tax=Araneus ventricosus TaxID=182803 RepID=A0A4Y2MGY0_ARAVE|nr:hypothetical protein AVEN_234139-1 [Araneus ventricosus]GBN26322.1 hypothetical protein AVEN_117900-1 [Araneus ventricosus]GBN26401.1 hypothetical protein AVEN_168605-1 [Araneus ventricosus]GBN26408.1 hypothetical protein AVEN_186005-1 [Araneus ventricosus]
MGFGMQVEVRYSGGLMAELQLDSTKRPSCMRVWRMLNPWGAGSGVGYVIVPTGVLSPNFYTSPARGCVTRPAQTKAENGAKLTCGALKKFRRTK